MFLSIDSHKKGMFHMLQQTKFDDADNFYISSLVLRVKQEKKVVHKNLSQDFIMSKGLKIKKKLLHKNDL